MVLAPADAGLAEPLFHPPFQLYPFQADLAARCYYNDASLLRADTGLGKTVMSIATGCMLFEDDQIDLMIVACEVSKLGEWEDDLREFTSLRTQVYEGPPTIKPLKRPPKVPGKPRSREEIRQRLGEFDVLVGVYETFRNDLAVWEDAPDLAAKKRLVPGPLIEALRGKRILYVADEAPAKVGARRSQKVGPHILPRHLYGAHRLLVKECREAGRFQVIVCSATPVERDPESYYNVVSLFKDIGNVTSFHRDHVASFDDYHRPSQFKNLEPGLCEPHKVSLKEKIGDILLVKSKLDADVINLFPKTVPDYSYVRLSPKEMEFYDWMVKEYGGGEEGGVYTPLRQFLGHPLALLHSQGGTAVDIQERVGEARLRALGASKCDALLERLRATCGGQGAQAVVYTFFGQTVLPVLYQEITTKAKLRVVINHGQMSRTAKDEAKRIFRSGGADVFLSSDAGARGINLPEASYVEEYDWPLKHTTHVQRINRISRIDSVNRVVFANAWAVRGTVEEDIISTMIRRQGWGEALVIQEQVTAEDLKALLKQRRDFVV